MEHFNFDNDMAKLFGGIILIVLSILYLNKGGDVKIIGDIMIAFSAFYVGSTFFSQKK
jgi:hypothetical protein